MLLLLISFALSNNKNISNLIHVDHYEKQKTWIVQKPEILICSKNKQRISLVKKAHSIWLSKGQSLGKITIGTENQCKEYYKNNTIVITGPKDYIESYEYACTLNLVIDQKKIKASHIELDNDADLYIVAHELGHALGYGHTNIKNDLMNESY